MLKLVVTKRFKKSIALCEKRGLDIPLFDGVAKLLVEEKPLPYRCQPHKLTGDYAGSWECHIKPDWLLIYRYENEKIIFEDTGTHSDLFKL